MEAVVLAGGLGTRLRGAVPDLPKPMAPVNGRPFLEHLLDYWIGQGIGRFVLSVGYRHEAVMSHFGAGYRGVSLDYAVEQTPLGTGGGLLLTLELLSGGNPFLLLNGDTYFEVPLSALVDFHDRHQADCTFALFRCPEDGRYMRMEVGEDGRITALNSRGGKPGRLANGGVYVLRSDALRDGTWNRGDRVSLEEDILPAALTSGRRLYGVECRGAFIDIGIPEDYFRAGGLLAA